MEWLNTAVGQSLLEQEQGAAGRVLETVFGDQIVQIGNWGPPGQLIESARTQFSVIIGDEGELGVNATASATRLAILTDSVDAVFLPHILELSVDPHGVLREVHRILRPNGKLIVLGFNPLSWWGLRHRLSRGFPPGIVRHISQRRLGDWLRLLSLSIDSRQSVYSSPSRNRASELLQSTDMFANGYILVATKDIIPMTIIRPRLRRRARLVETFANPTTRNVA